MSQNSPEALGTRYRCVARGNLDVTLTRRSRAFYHYSLGGELSVEDSEVHYRGRRVDRVPLVREREMGGGLLRRR